MENVPKWAGSVLKPEDLQPVGQAIQQAESKTSGEIVAMLVRRCSATSHVPVLLACLLLLAFFVLGLDRVQAARLGAHPAWILADAAVAALLAQLLSLPNFVRRRLTYKADRTAQVHARALNEFYLAGLDKTSGATGVLIFVSLMERQVVVLADKGIASVLPPETWKGVVTLALGGIRQGGLGQGLSAAVLKCGELLAPHFPTKPDDVNELENRLIIKE